MAESNIEQIIMNQPPSQETLTSLQYTAQEIQRSVDKHYKKQLKYQEATMNKLKFIEKEFALITKSQKSQVKAYDKQTKLLKKSIDKQNRAYITAINNQTKTITSNQDKNFKSFRSDFKEQFKQYGKQIASSINSSIKKAFSTVFNSSLDIAQGFAETSMYNSGNGHLVKLGVLDGIRGIVQESTGAIGSAIWGVGGMLAMALGGRFIRGAGGLIRGTGKLFRGSRGAKAIKPATAVRIPQNMKFSRGLTTASTAKLGSVTSSVPGFGTTATGLYLPSSQVAAQNIKAQRVAQGMGKFKATSSSAKVINSKLAQNAVAKGAVRKAFAKGGFKVGAKALGVGLGKASSKLVPGLGWAMVGYDAISGFNALKGEGIGAQIGGSILKVLTLGLASNETIRKWVLSIKDFGGEFVPKLLTGLKDWSAEFMVTMGNWLGKLGTTLKVSLKGLWRKITNQGPTLEDKQVDHLKEGGVNYTPTGEANQKKYLEQTNKEAVSAGNPVLSLAQNWDPTGGNGTYTVTSGYGKRNTGIPGASTNHKGVDIAMPVGTPINAPFGGTATFYEDAQNGRYAILENKSSGISALFGHLDQRSNPAPGATLKVSRGKPFAFSGASGVGSGPHLHYEIHDKSVKANTKLSKAGVIKGGTIDPGEKFLQGTYNRGKYSGPSGKGGKFDSVYDKKTKVNGQTYQSDEESMDLMKLIFPGLDLTNADLVKKAFDAARGAKPTGEGWRGDSRLPGQYNGKAHNFAGGFGNSRQGGDLSMNGLPWKNLLRNGGNTPSRKITGTNPITGNQFSFDTKALELMICFAHL